MKNSKVHNLQRRQAVQGIIKNQKTLAALFEKERSRRGLSSSEKSQMRTIKGKLAKSTKILTEIGLDVDKEVAETQREFSRAEAFGSQNDRKDTKAQGVGVYKLGAKLKRWK